MNKQNIVKNLTKTLTFCLCCILLVGVLCSIPLTVYGADEPSEGGGSSRITDLTGYTVTVPIGWTANAGFVSVRGLDILYNIPDQFGGTEHYEQGGTFDIGYNYNGPRANFALVGNHILVPSDSFTVIFNGGTGATNSMLIQWFYDNNASFVKNNVPALPTFKIYNPATQQITSEYYFEDGMTFFDWVNSDYNVDDYLIVSGVKESQIGLNDNIKNYVVSAVTDTTDIYNDVRILMTTAGIDQYSDSLIQSTNYMLGVMRLYKPCYSLGYDAGYIVGDEAGYHTGYDMGYADGLYQGQSSAIGENLIGSGFSAITDSLNHIILYQSTSGAVVTLWVVICGAIGIALFIWILKLFAGG